LAISAIYMGDNTEAAPTASPPINRAAINWIIVCELPEKLAERITRSKVAISNVFLHLLSLNKPATVASRTQPIINLPINQ
jgi:hypothetical protein